MTYRGRVKNGVIVLDPTNPLPDGTEMICELVDEVIRPSDNPEHPFFKMIDLTGPTGIPDLATNHDHFVQGRSKVGDERCPEVPRGK